MEKSMRTSSIVGLACLGLVAIFGLTWIGQGNDFFLYKVFAPKYEEVRHDVFKNSQAYLDGKVTNLSKLKMDYAKADTDEHRCAIRAMAVREASTVITDTRMPVDLIRWINKLQGDTSCD